MKNKPTRDKGMSWGQFILYAALLLSIFFGLIAGLNYLVEIAVKHDQKKHSTVQTIHPSTKNN